MMNSYIIRWKGHGHKTVCDSVGERERGWVLLQLLESHTAEAQSSGEDEETDNAKSQNSRERT